MANDSGMKEMNALIPSLAVNDAMAAIELYKKAFGAQVEREPMMDEANKVIHASVRFGKAQLFLSDMMPGDDKRRGTTSGFYMYLPDVDAALAKAKEAGMEELYPVKDMFWGDRVGTLRDKFGNFWTLATHVRDVSPEEMEEGRRKFSAMMAGKKPG